MPDSALLSHYFYTAPGIRLHAKVCGPQDAPVLLLVHGFPEFWYTWRKVLPAFARSHRCVALDLRGFNLSSQPAEISAYRPQHLLADLRTVIAQLGGRVQAVVAHDWGGALCWSLAAQAPALMERLVILNAPHTLLFARALAHDSAQIAASQYMNTLRQSDAEVRLQADNYAGVLSFVDSLTTLCEEELEQYRACWRHGLRGGCNLYRASPLHPDTAEAPGQMAATLAALQPENFRVKVPTQVIWGTGDAALRPVLLEGLDDLVDDLRIHRIEGAGHWIPHSHAEVVVDVMRAFMPPT